MSKRLFDELMSMLLPQLRRDEVMGCCSSPVVVALDVRLALTLLFLEGASYIDVMVLFGVSRAAIYSIFHDTFNAISAQLEPARIPFGDITASDALTCGFSASRARIHCQDVSELWTVFASR